MTLKPQPGIIKCQCPLRAWSLTSTSIYIPSTSPETEQLPVAQMDTHQAVSPASPQDSPPTPKVSCPCWHLDSHYTPILSVADPLLSSYTPVCCLLLIQQLQTTSGLNKPWTSLLSSELNPIFSNDILTLSKSVLLGYSPKALQYCIKFPYYLIINSLVIVNNSWH